MHEVDHGDEIAGGALAAGAGGDSARVRTSTCADWYAKGNGVSERPDLGVQPAVDGVGGRANITLRRPRSVRPQGWTVGGR